MLFVTYFVHWLVRMVCCSHLLVSLLFVLESHLATDCRVRVVLDSVEALDVGSKRSRGCHSWRENAASGIFEFVFVVSVRFLIDFVNPLGCKLFILKSGPSEIGPLISLNRERLVIGEALHDNAEVADAILGGVPVHLVEVRGEAGGDLVDLRLFHSVRHRRVIFKESSLLVVLITEQLQFLLERLKLPLEPWIRIDDPSGFPNCKHC